MKKNVLVLLVIFIFSIFIGLNMRTDSLPEMKVVKQMEGNASIGVLSDTHIPSRADEIPEEVTSTFREREVDLIIHAGDIVSPEVIDDLEEIAPVIAVCGNMDPEELCEKFQKTAIVEVGSNRIGVIHDTVNPFSNKMKLLAEENNLDLLIFGHTHRNGLKERNGTYFLNPGSPTQPILSSRSFAIVNVTDDGVEPKVINIED